MKLNIFIIFFYSFFIAAGEKGAIGKVAQWKAECIKARQNKNQICCFQKNDFCVYSASLDQLEKDQKTDASQFSGAEDNTCLAHLGLLCCGMVQGINNFFTASPSQSSHKSVKEKV